MDDDNGLIWNIVGPLVAAALIFVVAGVAWLAWLFTAM
jgi:hypothetical protein